MGSKRRAFRMRKRYLATHCMVLNDTSTSRTCHCRRSLGTSASQIVFFSNDQATYHCNHCKDLRSMYMFEDSLG